MGYMSNFSLKERNVKFTFVIPLRQKSSVGPYFEMNVHAVNAFSGDKREKPTLSSNVA